MNKTKRRILFLSALAFYALLHGACLFDMGDIEGQNRFEYDLRGTWVSNDPSVYSGTLEIDYNRITITGYGEAQTPAQGDDAKRPFRGFTKRTPLSGYSEEGKIFIEDAGFWQIGIPYTYYTQNRGQEEFLRFDFGGRTETLQKTR